MNIENKPLLQGDNIESRGVVLILIILIANENVV